MESTELIRTITSVIRQAGPAAALASLRDTRPDLTSCSPVAGGGYHDTIAVFYVWAIDRLVDAGLSDTAVLWHPLVDVRSPLSWWDEATLASVEARAHFVPSTLAAAWEPSPVEPSTLVAA